jgi:hypothetical protein
LEYLKFLLAISDGSQWQMSHISTFDGFSWSVGYDRSNLRAASSCESIYEKELLDAAAAIP